MLPRRSFSDHRAPHCAQHQPTTLCRCATMNILFWDAAAHAANTWRRPPAQAQRKATHVSGKIQLLPHSGLSPAGIRPSATVPCIARCLARIRTTIGAYSRYPLHHRWLCLPLTYHLLGLDDEDILSKVAINLPPAPFSDKSLSSRHHFFQMHGPGHIDLFFTLLKMDALRNDNITPGISFYSHCLAACPSTCHNICCSSSNSTSSIRMLRTSSRSSSQLQRCESPRPSPVCLWLCSSCFFPSGSI